MTNVYIVDGLRTPIGRFGQSLKDYSAVDLGAYVIRKLLEKTKVPPGDIDIVLMGNIIRAATGQDTARQAAIKAGIPPDIDAVTIDMVCSSGMTAVMMGASMIKAGDVKHGLVIAGGMESMSQGAFAITPKIRWGVRFLLREKIELIDTMYHDGLYDVIERQVMGAEADRVAKKRGVSREELDKIGYMSHMRAAKATKEGLFKSEIVPVVEGDRVILDHDEGIRPDTTLEKISKLPPAFGKDGLHTAATSSQLSDGAAALLLASEDAIAKYDLKPRARIVGYAWAAVETWRFVEAPPIAVKKVLEKTGYSLDEIEVFENNEAFAISSIIFNQDLGVPYDKFNLFGGAIALGHPVGCTGARIIVTLMNVMEKKGFKRGMASLCHGLGGATAILIERVE
ncbi:acetyl-CoA acetyltransferase [Candidatus Geothermarchaeota archaeon ex4572_27]|nr:MAG: acetyl-CoA acetyltransferase [Candidatus Geothermarchaeota archaeon ex4572_27]